ncbi:TadE/TadG family type IV pilus assembly protein, partial [Dietzia sp. NPDC055343]
MLRLSDDRGAAAVIIAILMVPLLGFAAISIDVAAMHAEKQQLQTGADAAALAIAQDCARDTCGSPRMTAQTLATANSNSGNAVATLPTVPTATTGRVTVENSAVRKHWFAPVLGVDESEINVRASASWGAPIGGTAALPLILTLCEFNRYAVNGFPAGVEQTIITTPAGNCLQTGAGNQPPHWVPGGFGWLSPTAHKSCYTKTQVGQKATSSPGNNMNQCDIS